MRLIGPAPDFRPEVQLLQHPVRPLARSGLKVEGALPHTSIHFVVLDDLDLGPGVVRKMPSLEKNCR